LFEWIQGLVKGSPLGLAEDATFADLKAKGGLDLYVFSTNLNLQTTPEFSADKSPDVQIAEAVRASMSIPIFFKAWRFSNDNPNDHVHVDGGVQYVFPLSIFDDSRFNADADADSYNEESLGLYLDNGGKAPVDNGLGCGEPELYVKTLFTSLLQGQDGLFKRNPGDVARTVMIDDMGISGTEFDLTQAQIDSLVKSGRDATAAHIANPPALES
jgi:NTE family protein